MGHSDPKGVQAGFKKITSILLATTQDPLKSRGATLLTSKNPLCFHAEKLGLFSVLLFYPPNPGVAATGGIGDWVGGKGEGGREILLNSMN